MTRARNEVESGIWHVFARGNNRQDIFVDSGDRRRYLSLLGRSVRRCEWKALAYCLMANHVHLLIETGSPNLGVGMQRLHTDYARAFNKRHRRSGHLFQGRFGSVWVATDEQLLWVTRYIVRNPVAAGLARDPADWRWSSHRAALGEEDGPPWLATRRLDELLAGWSGARSDRYRELTEPKEDCPL